MISFTYFVLDRHQTGSDDDDVQLTQPAGPLPNPLVEDVEGEDEEEDGCQSCPDNRQNYKPGPCIS